MAPWANDKEIAMLTRSVIEILTDLASYIDVRQRMWSKSAHTPRNDRPDHGSINFTGDAWLGYVPLRMPDTICVQERLPLGAAAVLINQTHAYRDLIMPVDSTEKRLFDAIDGNCSIADIVENVWPSSQTKSQLDIARTFFENLWWYDQVVFDASQRRERKEEP